MADSTPLDDASSTERQLLRFAHRLQRRATGMGGQSIQWVDSLQDRYPSPTSVDPTIATQGVIQMVRRIGSPRLVRDAKAWESSSGDEDVSNLDNFASQIPRETTPSWSIPPESPINTSPLDVTTVPAKIRFHRSLRHAALQGSPAIESPSPPDPEGNARRSNSSEAELWKALDQQPGHPVSHVVHEQLATPLGPSLPAAAEIKIHDDQTADALTRLHQADAVTNRNQIAFRIGSFRPESPQGLSLLAHEMVHVTHARDTSTRIAPRDEEQQALMVERQMLGQPSQRVTGEQPAPGPAMAPDVSPQSRAAAENRPLDPPPQPNSAMLTPSQIRELKQQIYRDLVNRIRVEFERGGT